MAILSVSTVWNQSGDLLIDKTESRQTKERYSVIVITEEFL